MRRDQIQAVLANKAFPRYPNQVQQGQQQQQASLAANSQGDIALGYVVAATPAFSSNQGFNDTITDNGVGDLTLVLTDQQALLTQGIVSVTVNSALPSMWGAVPVGTTGVRIRTWSATVASGSVVAAADLDYWVRIGSLPPA